jgi:hypothetical protein
MKRITLPLALVFFAGCGDPVLPSDYSGPPAAAVSGNAIRGIRDAERPRMSLVWLGNEDATLMVQPLAFERSVKLQHDWDIRLFLPIEGAAQYEVPVEAGAGGGARIGVAKIVYFDDRNHTDTLEWTCGGPTCDQVLAISDQYVLFVDRPSWCQEPGKAAHLRPTGYHYYAFDTGTMVMRQLADTESMSFTLIDDKTQADSRPTQDLVDFRTHIRRAWQTGLRGSCAD